MADKHVVYKWSLEIQNGWSPQIDIGNTCVIQYHYFLGEYYGAVEVNRGGKCKGDSGMNLYTVWKREEEFKLKSQIDDIQVVCIKYFVNQIKSAGQLDRINFNNSEIMDLLCD